MVPTDRRYLESHEWAKLDGEVVTVGISAFAVEHLSDLTFIDLPEVGTRLEQGDRFGEIESVKAVSELFSPIAGEVVEVNDVLADDVDKVSADPFGDGWMMKVKVKSGNVVEHLLQPEVYQKQCDEESD